MAGKTYATRANPCPVCDGGDRCTRTTGHRGDVLLLCFRSSRTHPGLKPRDVVNGWRYVGLDKHHISGVFVLDGQAPQTVPSGSSPANWHAQRQAEEDAARRAEHERVRDLVPVLIGGLISAAYSQPTPLVDYFRTRKKFKADEVALLDLHHGRPSFPHPVSNRQGDALALAQYWKATTTHTPLVDVYGVPWNIESLDYQPAGKCPRYTLKGGRVDGLFVPIPYHAPRLHECRRVDLVEGVASGLALHLLLKDAGIDRKVLACRSASNIPKVADALRRAYPHLQIVIKADPDEAGQKITPLAVSSAGG